MNAPCVICHRVVYEHALHTRRLCILDARGESECSAQVFRLHITVDHSSPVHEGQGIGNLLYGLCCEHF